MHFPISLTHGVPYAFGAELRYNTLFLQSIIIIKKTNRREKPKYKQNIKIHTLTIETFNIENIIMKYAYVNISRYL